jgi:magnesium-transporting ATPase (P-type)
MGGVDNLCLTKTGFITKNLLSVTEIFIEEKTTNILSKEIMSEKTCKILSLAIIMNTQACPKFVHRSNNSLQVLHVGNKTESALLEMVYLMGYNYETIRMNPKVKIKRIYSSSHPKRKMGTVYWDEQGKLYLFVKGSPNFLLNYCTSFINKDGLVKSLDFNDIDAINKSIRNFGKINVHVVMIVYQKISKVPNTWSQIEKNFTLIAIIGVKDALRHNVKETIEQCSSSGIVVRLLSN